MIWFIITAHVLIGSIFCFNIPEKTVVSVVIMMLFWPLWLVLTGIALLIDRSDFFG